MGGSSRALGFLVVLVGCSRPNPLFLEVTGDGGGSATEGDASTGDGATGAATTTTDGAATTTGDATATTMGVTATSGPPDGSTTAVSPAEMICPQVEALAACYYFWPGRPGVLHDGSVHGMHGTMAIDALIGGPDGFGYAADVGESSAITVVETAQTDALDVVGAITFMAVFYLQGPVNGGRVGLLDKEGQYSIFLDASGALLCKVAGGQVGDSEPAPVGVWIHVACTYDGAGITLYRDGALRAAVSHDLAIAQNVGDLEIGGNSVGPGNADTARLIGHVDAIEIWSGALTPAEICARAGSLCPG